MTRLTFFSILPQESQPFSADSSGLGWGKSIFSHLHSVLITSGLCQARLPRDVGIKILERNVLIINILQRAL